MPRAVARIERPAIGVGHTGSNHALMRAEVFGRPRMAVLGTIRGRRECLSRPGQIDIQTELFYDYRSNVERYPQWQRYLREHRPPTLVVWGKYDASFTVEGAHAYGRELPDARIHLLDAGHFALDEACDEIGALTHAFLTELGRS